MPRTEAVREVEMSFLLGLIIGGLAGMALMSCLAMSGVDRD